MTTNESKQENIFNGDTRIAGQNKPKAKASASAHRGARKRKDWLAKFCEARFDILRQSLSPENQASWERFSFDRKCYVIQCMVRKGCMI